MDTPINKIISQVCYETNVTVAMIMSSSHEEKIIKAKHLAIYLLKKRTGLTLKTIGKKFNLGHSSVIMAIKSVENQAKYDDDYKQLLETLNCKL